MTIEDAIAWLASRDASVIFRSNGSQPKSVIVLIHSSPVRTEKPTLGAAVEECARRLAQYSTIERERLADRREKRTPGATK